MDYRVLLAKYMQLVMEAEGVDFLYKADSLTAEELAELEKISDEVCAEMKVHHENRQENGRTSDAS